MRVSDRRRVWPEAVGQGACAHRWPFDADSALRDCRRSLSKASCRRDDLFDGAKLMFHNRMLAILTAFVIASCSVEEPSKFINTEFDGFNLKTSASRVVSHYAGSERFLRVNFNTFDLILDSRLQVFKEPDYMSVLPTRYGHGKPRMYGEYRVLCTDVGYYACGYKFTVKDKYVLILFRKPPTSNTQISQSKAEVTSFLSSGGTD